MESRDLSEFEENIGYCFTSLALLEEALRHSSFANEAEDSSLRDNERFEFLGDAVLSLVIGQRKSGETFTHHSVAKANT